MINVCTLFLVLFFCSFSYALEGKMYPLNEVSKEILEPRNKWNAYEFDKVSFKASEVSKLKDKKVDVKYGFCRVYKKSPKYPGYVVSKTVKYTSEVRFPLQHTLVVNGIRVKGKWIEFELRDGCKKLLPVRFISSKKQKFLGFEIDEDDEISYHAGNEGYYPFGAIFNSSGYIIEKKPLKENLHKHNLKGRVTVRQCLQINKKNKKKFYYFNEKLYSSSDVATDFTRAPSLYWGHRVCSDRPKAKILCEGLNLDYDRYFDLSEDDEEDREYLIRDYSQGKKDCDEKIKTYEAKTGKKVPISPHIPKKYIERIKKNSMTMFER